MRKLLLLLPIFGVLTACTQSRPASVHELRAPSPESMPAKTLPVAVSARSAPSHVQVPQKVPRAQPATVTQSGWQWPLQGKVVQPFSLAKKSVNKGIDIAGKVGQTVYAAAAGKVVFAGAGAGGLGNGQMLMIEVKRNLLTVYAHNQKLWVRQGQKVRLGQAIAQLGKMHQQPVTLHFEVRVKGQPVNPLSYLPRKSS